MATYYVSNTVANGIGVGNDETGNGSEGSPFLTLDKALAVAQQGDTIILNNGTYSPAAGTFDITQGVTIDSVVNGGATIVGTGGQNPLSINVTNGGTVTLGAVNIDGQGVASNDVALSSESQTFALNLAGTHLRNATGYAVAGQTDARVNITANDVTYTATTSFGMLGLSSLAAGNINVERGSILIADQTAGPAGYTGEPQSASIGLIDAVATGVSVIVSGVTVDAIADSSNQFASAIAILNVPDAVVQDNAITLSGQAKAAIAIEVGYDFLHPLSAVGAQIKNNTVYNFNTGGGAFIQVGADLSPGQALWGYADNARVTGNVGIGDAVSQASDLHGILVGWQSGATVSNNFVEDTELAYVMKGDFGTNIVSDNLDMDSSGKSWYQKAGTSVEWLDNASYQEAAYRPVGLYVGPDIETSFTQNASGDVAKGNTIWYAGPPAGGHFVELDPGSTIKSLTDNHYHSDGPLNYAAWDWQGTFYTTLAQWQASHESTATGTTSGDTFAQYIASLKEGFTLNSLISVANVSDAGTKLTVNDDVVYAGGLTLGKAAAISIASGDNLTLADASSVSGSVSGAGSLSVANGSLSLESGAKLSTARWSIFGGSATFLTSLDYAGTFSASGDDRIDLTGGRLVLRGPASFIQSTVGGSNRLYTEGTTTVADFLLNGSVWLENTGTILQSDGNVSVGASNSDQDVLYNASTGTYQIADNSGIVAGAQSAIDNAGLFEKTGGIGVSAIAGAIVNTGTVEVSSGTLDIRGAVSGVGGAVVSGAATLEFDSTVASGQTVGFSGAGGDLVLDAPQGFVGKIANFGAGDSIDVAGPFAYAGFVENGAGTLSTLNFSNGSTDISIVLLGQYMAAGFTAAAGPSGSTLITYTPPPDHALHLATGH